MSFLSCFGLELICIAPSIDIQALSGVCLVFFFTTCCPRHHCRPLSALRCVLFFFFSPLYSSLVRRSCGIYESSVHVIHEGKHTRAWIWYGMGMGRTRSPVITCMSPGLAWAGGQAGKQVWRLLLSSLRVAFLASDCLIRIVILSVGPKTARPSSSFVLHV